MRVLSFVVCVLVLFAAMYAAAGQGCNSPTAYPNSVMNGNDLEQFQTTSQSVCQSTCCSNPLCLSFFYGQSTNALTPNCPQGTQCCFLKSAVGTTVSNPYVTSYQWQCPQYSTLPGFNVLGGDIESFPTGNIGDTVNPTICQVKCCQTTGCVAYSTSLSPIQENGCLRNQPCCYLKSTIPQVVTTNDQQAQSGIKLGANVCPA